MMILQQTQKYLHYIKKDRYILPSQQQTIIEEAKYTYSSFGKAL